MIGPSNPTSSFYFGIGEISNSFSNSKFFLEVGAVIPGIAILASAFLSMARCITAGYG